MRTNLYWLRILTVLLMIGLLYLLPPSNVIYDSFTISSSRNLNNKTDSSGQDGMFPDIKTEVQYALVVCKDEDPQNKMTYFQPHVNHLNVLLKSAAVLTSTVITFNIISNSEEVYNQLINMTTEWPTKYSQRLRFPPMRNVYYPPEFQYLIHLFKPCATQRLFLIDVLKDLDAVIYIDTDTYFMQPPEDLWVEFNNFDHRQLIGISPHSFAYLQAKKFPVYGPAGFNSGVMLMNLTRMKMFPKGWHASINNILNSFPQGVFNGDQALLNAFFSGENEVYIHEIGCEWNYAKDTCGRTRNFCPEAVSKGIALLHHKKIHRIKGIYEAWSKYDLRSPVKELMVLMKEGVKHYPNKNLCLDKYSNATDIILKGIMRRFISVL